MANQFYVGNWTSLSWPVSSFTAGIPVPGTKLGSFYPEIRQKAKFKEAEKRHLTYFSPSTSPNSTHDLPSNRAI